MLFFTFSQQSIKSCIHQEKDNPLKKKKKSHNFPEHEVTNCFVQPTVKKKDTEFDDIKQRKATNTQRLEAGVTQSLEFYFDEWL